MKKSLLAGVSLGALALATSAQAADVATRPTYKAPVAAPAWSWAGFYIGGNVGFVSARSSVSEAPGALPALGGATVSDNGTSFIGGFQAGYNWQFTNIVLGVEADVSFGSQTRTTNNIIIVGSPTGTFNSRLSTLSTIRGRLGVAFDRVLIYGTGGVAFANIKDELLFPPIPAFLATPSSNVTGWTAGFGVEYAVTGNWTVKAEYLHVGFASRNASTTPAPGVTYSFAFKDSFDIGRLGLNYRF